MWAVVQIATFRPTAEIIAGLREHWGVSISEEGLRHYRASNPHCPQRWRDLAEKARAEWNDKVSAIPIANASYRVAVLQETLDQAKGAPKVNPVLVLSILEQAASDVGGRFTSRHDFTGIPPAGPPVIINPTLSALDLDAAGEAQLRGVLRRALGDPDACESTGRPSAGRGRAKSRR